LIEENPGEESNQMHLWFEEISSKLRESKVYNGYFFRLGLIIFGSFLLLSNRVLTVTFRFR
jgi:hypothetical protein